VGISCIISLPPGSLSDKGIVELDELLQDFRRNGESGAFHLPAQLVIADAIVVQSTVASLKSFEYGSVESVIITGFSFCGDLLTEVLSRSDE